MARLAAACDVPSCNPSSPVVAAHDSGSPRRSGDGPAVNAAAAADLRRLVAEAERASVFMLLGKPACPFSRSACSAATVAAAHPCAQFRARGCSLVKDLALDVSQEDALLEARAQLLVQLRALYEARAALNAKTVGLMQPRPEGAAGDRECDDTTDGKLRCIEQYGSMRALRDSHELRVVLDSIRHSLCQEVKLLVHLHKIVVKQVRSRCFCLLGLDRAWVAHPSAKALLSPVRTPSSVAAKRGSLGLQVLTPVQAAVLFVRAEDSAVEQEMAMEVLHICNIVAMRRGVIPDPCAGKSADAQELPTAAS